MTTRTKAPSNGTMKMSELKTLPLDFIKEPNVALRPVDKASEGYLSLVESIRERGVLQPIVVREIGAEFILVAGRHRLYAARDAGLAEIGAMVHEGMDDVEAMTAQVIENVHRAETKPIEYANMIQRIMKD